MTKLQHRAALLALSFTVLCTFVASGVTQPLDHWVQTRAHAIASSPLDIAASLVTTLGKAEITGTLTLMLSFLWWQRRGVRGLVPLLFFVGVVIEVVLKYSLPTPERPPGLARGFEIFSFLHFSSPFSFPSGHALRTTFLVALIDARTTRWRIAGWVLIVVIALTRLYLNVHSLSDVVGGILLGLTLATVAAAVASSSPAANTEPRR